MRKGFILVEWMIQFLLCSLIIIIAFALFHTWSTRMNSLHKNLDAALQMPNAYDLLRRDVQEVPAEMIDTQHDRCKINKSGQLIIWRHKNNSLYRVLKNYDTKQKKWRKAVQSTTVENLPTCSFAPINKQNNKNDLTGVRLTCGNPSCVYIIGLRNGNEL